jgi:hypothetical protein
LPYWPNEIMLLIFSYYLVNLFILLYNYLQQAMGVRI